MADRSCLQGLRTTLYPHHTPGDQRATLGPHHTLGVREPCWVPPHSRDLGTGTDWSFPFQREGLSRRG